MCSFHCKLNEIFLASWASAKVETILESKPARYNEFWAEETLIERIAASK